MPVLFLIHHGPCAGDLVVRQNGAGIGQLLQVDGAGYFPAIYLGMDALFYDMVVVFAMFQYAVNSSPKQGPDHVGRIFFYVVPVFTLELHNAGAIE